MSDKCQLRHILRLLSIAVGFLVTLFISDFIGGILNGLFMLRLVILFIVVVFMARLINWLDRRFFSKIHQNTH
jgi:hypothetical protein